MMYFTAGVNALVITHPELPWSGVAHGDSIPLFFGNGPRGSRGRSTPHASFAFLLFPAPRSSC